MNNAWAQQLYDPQISRKEIKEADIDTENFELGAFVGVMSIEDFGTNPIFGARLAYHVTELLFMEISAGQTTTDDEIVAEQFLGQAQILPSSDRDLFYYQFSAGFNVLPGEVFWRNNRAWNIAVYLQGGVGITEFAEDEYYTIHVGGGIRWLLTDWLALHSTLMDHIFDNDLFATEKTIHNLSWHTGLTFFF